MLVLYDSYSMYWWFLQAVLTDMSLYSLWRRNLTHCGRVTQICVFTLQLCRTGDADLRFYVTIVQDGWRRFPFLRYNCAGRVTQICVFNTVKLGTSASSVLRPAAARLLRSWVRIPPGVWIFVCCECRVLSGRGLCDELITRPGESYRLCCVVVCDLERSRMVAPYIYDISRLRVNA